MKNVQLLRLVSGEEILADVDLNGIDTDTVILKSSMTGRFPRLRKNRRP